MVAQNGLKGRDKQKADMAKFYTSMNGVLENSIQAYMDISQIETEKKRRPRRKKKRAASQAAGEQSPSNGAESRQNLLVQEDEE